MMDLNQYGAACRCLLRLRENRGNPWISDERFIAQFIEKYPQWQDRPGILEGDMLLEVASDLGLASSLSKSTSYDAILGEHLAGKQILICTECAPVLNPDEDEAGSHVMLLVHMDKNFFTLWCPYRSGQSEQLPPTPRLWWEKWRSTGLVLHESRDALPEPTPSEAISGRPPSPMATADDSSENNWENEGGSLLSAA